MKELFDVVISGSGPSGSILGYLLSSNGYSVLIIDKEEFPRYKVCAGGIQVKAAELIPFNIDSQIHNEIRKIHFQRRTKDGFLGEYDEPLMYTLDRESFDSYLVEKAIGAGCTIRTGEKVKDISVDNNEVTVFTDKGKYYGKIFTGSDGASGFTIKKFNDYRKIRKIIGYELEIPVSGYFNKRDINGQGKKEQGENIALFERNCIVLDFGGVKYGYLWLFPKNKKISAGMGGLSAKSKEIKKYLSMYIKNTELLSINPKEKFQSYAHFIPLRDKKNFISSRRVLATGDAAGLGDGFTGEGLHNAILSSHLAFSSICKALKNSSFEFVDYNEKIRNEIMQNIEYSLIISKIFFSSQYFYYKLIKRNENIFRSCCKILRGEKTYLDVVNKLKPIKI
ncbi:MAG: geranylgeranyl reductase family protein [Actinomycetota bacterium]|nr:geranylgeranyl reductase family protein [Actinomycetota bacterium]